jgi:hypothetical protein
MRGKKSLGKCCDLSCIELGTHSRALCDSPIRSVEPGEAEQLAGKQGQR